MEQVLLILTLLSPGQPPQEAPVGVMFGPDACIVAGTGMAKVIEAENPGTTVSFTCIALPGQSA